MKRAEELRDQVVPMVQSHRQALIEVAGRGVERRVEGAAVATGQTAGIHASGGGDKNQHTDAVSRVGSDEKYHTVSSA